MCHKLSAPFGILSSLKVQQEDHDGPKVAHLSLLTKFEKVFELKKGHDL